MKLPPMSAIRVFEAAARHQSFTRAAEELGMTQAAVSYQVRLLEDRLGLPLFLRLPRQVSLTPKGRELAEPVAEAFSLLRAAFTDFEEGAQATVSVTTMVTIASNWLIPRLGQFRQRHPTIAVQLSITDQLVDLARSEFDIGIRSGDGRWPGLQAHRLIPNHFTPACGPALLQGEPPYPPSRILEMPLLSPRDPWWQEWCRAAGLGAVDLTGRPHNAFDAQQYEGLAAMAGQGVALINPFFFGADIEAGRLVLISDVMVRSQRPYWLVYPSARQRSKPIRAFRDWILGEMPGEGGTPP